MTMTLICFFQLRDKESDYKKTMEQLKKEREELNQNLKSMQEGKLVFNMVLG